MNVSCAWVLGPAMLLPLAGCAERPTLAKSGSKPAAQAVSADAARADTPPADTAAAPSAAPPAEAAATYELATGTVYYSGDPLRGHKPEGTLRRGTKVALVHRAGVYSVVRSEDGLQAYVATHTLAPLEAH